MMDGKATTPPNAAWTPTGDLLDKARRARIDDPAGAPRALLAALQQRIRELDPDAGDLWAAARRIAKARGDTSIEAGYWSAMAFEQDCRTGRIQYDDEDWETALEFTEITMRMLERP